MKLSCTTGLLVLLTATIAFADVYSDDCDKMRDLAVTLSVNLQAINKSVFNESVLKDKQFDLKSYNEGVRNIADAIDGLTYKINLQCK